MKKILFATSEAVPFIKTGGLADVAAVILDTSGKLLEEGIKAAPTLIKPNIDEIRMLTGKHCDDINDIIEAAKAIHAAEAEGTGFSVSLGRTGGSLSF